MSGLEYLVQEVRQESASKAKKIKEEAESKADAIITDAEKEASEIIAKMRESASREAEARQTQVSAARLKARQVLSEEKDRVVSETIKELEKELEEFSESRDYKPVFTRLAKQAATDLGRKDFDLLVNKRDLGMAKSLGYSVKQASIIGGAIASSKDGLVRVNNSFETILEEQNDVLKTKAFEELFSSAEKVETKKGKK